MANVIIIIGFLAILHYLYEAVLAPTFRLKMRHELFMLRDSLHKIKLEALSNDDQEIVKIIESSINNILDRMTHINLTNIIRMNNVYEHDHEFKKIIDDFNMKIKSSHNDGIKNIDRKLTLLTGKALIVNVGALLMYLMPIFILSRIVSRLYKGIKLWIEKNSQGFLLTPNNRYSHLSISY